MKKINLKLNVTSNKLNQKNEFNRQPAVCSYTQ